MTLVLYLDFYFNLQMLQIRTTLIFEWFLHCYDDFYNDMKKMTHYTRARVRAKTLRLYLNFNHIVFESLLPK